MSDIYVGNRTVFRFTVNDQAGAAVDFSGATLKQLRFKSPHKALYAVAASFTTDGTDGVLEARFSQPAPKGLWEGYVYVEGVDGFNGRSGSHLFPVLDS